MREQAKGAKQGYSKAAKEDVPERMSERDGAPVRVHSGRVECEQLHVRERDGGEGLVYLPPADVLHSHSRSGEQLPHGLNGGHRKVHRLHRRVCKTFTTQQKIFRGYLRSVQLLLILKFLLSPFYI